jgi:hypothetical protein
MTTLVVVLVTFGLALIVAVVVARRVRRRAEQLREIDELAEANNVNLPPHWMVEDDEWREGTLTWLRQVDAERRRSEEGRC